MVPSRRKATCLIVSDHFEINHDSHVILGPMYCSVMYLYGIPISRSSADQHLEIPFWNWRVIGAKDNPQLPPKPESNRLDQRHNMAVLRERGRALGREMGRADVPHTSFSSPLA